MVEAAEKTNSVIISVGIKLDVLFCSSFRRAPSSDCNKHVLATFTIWVLETVYFSCGTSIVNFWIKTLVIAEIQFVFEMFHGDTSTKRVTFAGR